MMDRNGIQVAMTSISSPGVYFGDAPFAVRLARRCNEKAALLVAAHPGRFGAFATLPLPDDVLSPMIDLLNLPYLPVPAPHSYITQSPISVTEGHPPRRVSRHEQDGGKKEETII